MLVSMHNDLRELAMAESSGVYSLLYQDALWAEASMNSDASTVTLGCRSYAGPVGHPARVRVLLETTIPLACIVDASALSSWPTSPSWSTERPRRGPAQLMRLVDAGGLPWAQIVVGDQVRLFDPSGHERARVLRTWNGGGSRLVVRCWNEQGQELVANEPVPT